MTNHRHYARTRLSLRTRSSRRSASCGGGGGVSFLNDKEKTQLSSSTFCHDGGKISTALKEPHVSDDEVSSTECGMKSSLLSDARMEACNDDQIRDAAGLLMLLRTSDGIFLDDDTSTSDQHPPPPPPQNKKRTATTLTTGDSLTSIPTITPCVVSSPLIPTAAERTRLLSGSSISLADTAWASTGAAAVVASSSIVSSSSTVSTTKKNKNCKKKTTRMTATKGRSPITKKKRGPGRPPKKRGRPAGRRGRTSIVDPPAPSAVTTISSSAAVVAPTLGSPSSSRENVITATDAPVAAAAAVRVASSTTTSTTTMRLSTPEDPSNLSQLHCFIRSNLLELVVLKDDDKKTQQNQDYVLSDEHPPLQVNNNKNSMSLQLFDQCRSPDPPPRHHRVGLRCVYCAQVEEEELFGVVDDRHCKSSAFASSSSNNNNNNNNNNNKIRLPTRTMHPFFPKSLEDLYWKVSNWQQVHFSVCQHIPASVRSKYKELKKAKTRGKTAYWVSSARDLGLSNVGGRSGICFKQS